MAKRGASSFRMPAVLKKSRFYVVAAVWAAALLFPVFMLVPDALAQITKTARIELSEDGGSVAVGPEVYITPATEKHLNEQIIASRHENNLRGARQDSEVINLGLAPAPVWMVFSVTNNSRHEDWVLDFGTLSQGRTGLVHRLMVKNNTRDEIFARAMREEGQPGAFGETLQGTAIPVKIGIGKTELFVVYLEADGGLPAIFVPRLMNPKKHMDALRHGDIPALLMIAALIAAAAFFGAAAYLEKMPLYGLFSAYYIGHAVIILIVQSLFFMALPVGGDLVSLLFPLCFLIGVAMTWVFLGITAEDYSDNAVILLTVSLITVAALLALVLPAQNAVLDDILMFVPSTGGMLAMAALSFNHAQRGQFPGYFMASGWAASLAGMIIAMPSAAGLLSGNRIFLDAYWISLFPQAFFFAAGLVKQVERKHVDERAALSRESRAAQSLARLKQSKETADQARLLRVIERERELMAELREQEMQRTEEMRHAKEMADQANRAKSAFLAVVSHEIRTPMTGIMGILRLFKGTKLSKEQSDYLLTIQKSSDTMMALLNDILDFEKIESGSMALEEVDFDLPKLVQGVVTLMAGHAADRKNNLVADFADDFPAVLKGDPNRLRQILLNLVNNAIKFTQNGTVTIRLRAVKIDKLPGVEGDYEVYFGVEDTGIGISEKAQEKLFTPFEQADSSVSRKYGGTGLGLAICKKLVAAMGGAIGMSSQIGVGSTFYFSLLMKRGDAESAMAETEMPATGTEALHLAHPMEILVVEDNEINRKVLKNFLEKEGHHVSLADSAESGLDVFSRKKFEVVFLDINMSGMNGLEAARIIRSMPDRVAASTPLVALTGNIAPEDVQSFYDAGINGFIGKPIDYDLLLETLRKIQEGVPLSATSARITPTRFVPERMVPEDAQAGIEESDLNSIEIYRSEPERKERGHDDTDVAPIHKYLREEENPAVPAVTAPVAMDANMFDMKMLDGLLRSLGKDQMRELLGGFIEKTDEIVVTLRQASGAGDSQAVYESAHELKGMAANFGMKELAKLAGAAEKAAKTGQISPEIAKLPDVAVRTKSGIQGWLA
jgi:signal transduction histidine kinase/DNA-binding NarL/FixJ family response regulator/HPt (histidine-containing phosphotransfer) domain-containing protein